ncbi:hypothetical protein C5E19_15940 [Pectobacterium parmentieri]|nr:hypothetical protein C5E19_15940 [Pectobacterium parmentieri]
MSRKLTSEVKAFCKSSRLLLSYLQSVTDKHGLVEISLVELSVALGLCRQTITKATASLESLGIVTVIRGRRSKAKSGKVSAGKNVYRLSRTSTSREGVK